MEEDSSAALRTIGKSHAVNARWVALEVAGISRAVYSAVRKRSAYAICQAVRIGLSINILYALGQRRNARAFVGSHQRRFLQEFSDVAVQRRIPADQGLQRDRIHLSQHCRAATISAGRIVRMLWCSVDLHVIYEASVQRQSEETRDLPPPRVDSA